MDSGAEDTYLFGPTEQTQRVVGTSGFNDTYGDWPSNYIGLNGETMNSPGFSNDLTSRLNMGILNWYKVSIQINLMGDRYRVMHNGQNISTKFQDQFGNYNTNPLLTFEAPHNPGGYNNWAANWAEIFPNGFEGNTTEVFTLDFSTGASSTPTVDIYFVGWEIPNYGTAGMVQIVQESIRFTPPDLTRNNYEY